jgi:hypothetical protein
VRNDRDIAVGERGNVMIEALQREAVKVGKIAGDVELHHLPLAAREILASGKPAIDQQQAVAELLAGSDDNLIGGHKPHLRDRITDHALFFGADLNTPSQLLQQNRDHYAALSGTRRRICG